LSALSSSPIRKNKLPVSRQLWREIGSPQRQGRIFMKESIVMDDDDVIVGQTVGGLAKETAPGKWEVVTLNIGGKAGRAKDAR
jgi:hypothetical protein